MKTLTTLSVSLLIFASSNIAATIDRSGFKEGDGFSLETKSNALRLEWPADEGKGFIEFDFRPQNTPTGRTPLIKSIGIRGKQALSNLDPHYILWVGPRDLERRKGWTIFFDRVQRKRYTAEKAFLEPENIKASRNHNIATIEISGLSSDSFSGSLAFIAYEGSPFIRMEARVSTEKEATAFLYHCGLSKRDINGETVHYIDPFGNSIDKKIGSEFAAPLQTKYRSVAVASDSGSLGIMPPPHQFLYPLDFADNYGYNWSGLNYSDFIIGYSWGIRQPPIGDNRFAPWVNAAPGDLQKLPAFLVISDENGAANLEKIKSYTRSDSFKPLPGYKTFTSHYHIEHALDYIEKQKAQGVSGIPQGLENPEFVDVFKKMGVEIVHLAEFHKRATPGMATQPRLEQLKVLHEECARLSDEGFLLLPGEEPNVHLGGHWISFFPTPVNWVLNRPDGTPFEQEIEGFGKVYHVGSQEDVLKLFEKENGLMWTAHARIKSSTGFPDFYKDNQFFKSDHFLGAAWKAMPADYSRDMLGWRVLDLLDDMNNWGNRKQILGEVDIFKIYKGYELYGAMNINYIKLDQLPSYEEGWQPILDTIRAGSFFTTTGEILITDFSVNGKESGQVLQKKLKKAKLSANLEWTFPLSHAEIVTGDGEEIFRQRIELLDTKEFNTKTLSQKIDLSNRAWVRIEVWDIAANGAFTQPVWVK